MGEKPRGLFAAQERARGITDKLKAAGLRLGGTAACQWWPEPAYVATRELLTGRRRPTALICFNDRVAMGVYEAATEVGLSIPDDISVISFDDSKLASWLRPQLTSVALPHFDMGYLAARLVIEGDAAQVHRVPMPLHTRASIAPPAT